MRALRGRPELGDLRPVAVDQFFEAGIGYMCDHRAAGGDPDPQQDLTFGKGSGWDAGSPRCDGVTPPTSSARTSALTISLVRG